MEMCNINHQLCSCSLFAVSVVDDSVVIKFGVENGLWLLILFFFSYCNEALILTLTSF